jgi:hypothetical protein
MDRRVRCGLFFTRAEAGVSLGHALVSASGQLGWRNDVAATTPMSSTF